MTQERHTQKGFTLIEMVISLMILSLIGIVMVNQLRLQGKAWQRAAVITELNEEAQATFFVKAYLLSTAIPLFIEPNVGETFLLFEGDANRVVFAALGAAPPVDVGMQVYEWALEPADGVRIWRVYRSDLETYLETEDVAVAGIMSDLGEVPSSARFLYLGKDERSGEAIWQTGWERPDLMPMGIAISADRKMEGIPYFVGALNASRPVCLLADQSGYCDLPEGVEP